MVVRVAPIVTLIHVHVPLFNPFHGLIKDHFSICHSVPAAAGVEEQEEAEVQQRDHGWRRFAGLDRAHVTFVSLVFFLERGSMATL